MEDNFDIIPEIEDEGSFTTVAGSENTEEAELSPSESWLEVLKLRLRDEQKNGLTPLRFSGFLGLMLRGVGEQVTAPFAGKLDTDEDGDPLMKLGTVETTDDNETYYVLQTRESEHFGMTASVPLEMVSFKIAEKEKISGFVINPYEENIIIPREFVCSALLMASEVLSREISKKIEELEEKAEEDKASLETGIQDTPEEYICELSAPRPMEQEQWDGLEALLDHIGDAGNALSLRLNMENAILDDAVQAFLISRSENGYRLEIHIDMSDWKWDKPLRLAKDDLPLEELEDILYRLCVDGQTTDQVEAIMEFRSMD